MPGITVPRRRARESDDSDEENVSDSAASSSSVRSDGSKRARLDHDTLSEKSGSPVLPDSYRSQPPANGDGEYAVDPHQPGSIVRITLTNFVTYTAAEFLPGPSLNMIIGPNGTGKSTLVCAICLGLGWPAGNLGRAKEAGEYVKHGAREAEIEIELAGGRLTKNKNPIIRRIIKKEGSKSTFYLNGRVSSAKAVMELARSFSIQIDNLCQFLPQDRVVEFAQLTPVEKLRETQRAVASDEVVKMHEKLIECRQTQKKGQVDQKQRQDHLNALLVRQNAQRADVERQQERQSLLIKENALKSMRSFIEYRQAKHEVEDAKQAKKEARSNLIRLQREVEPSLRAVNAKQAYRDQIKEVVTNRKRMVQAKENSAAGYTQQLQAKEDQIKEIEAQIQGEKTSDIKNKEKIIKHERDITRIKRLMEEEPAPFDSVECNKKIRDKKDRQRELQEQATEKNDEQAGLTRQVTELKARRAQEEKELEGLRSQSGRQVNKLKAASPETATAWDWIQKSGNQFEGTIYGPPIVSCGIKDPKYADALESMIQKSEFTSFTCTNMKDFKTLQNELLGKMKLHDINIRVVTRAFDQWQPPVSNNTLQEDFGLEGWLIDFVEGPEPVLAMLCDNSNLHRTAVTLQPDNDEQFNRLANSPIQTWVAGKKSFRIIRRKDLGPTAVSTAVRPLRKANYWTDQPIDTGAERDIRTRIGELDMRMEELKRRYEELKEEKQRMFAEKKALQAEQDALVKEKTDRQNYEATFIGLPTKLADAETEKKRTETTRAELKQRIAGLTADIQNLQLEKGQLVLDYANAVENLRIACVALMEAEILHIEASSEYESIAAENNHIRQMLEETRRAEADITAKHADLLRRAKRLADKCREIRDSRSSVEADIHEAHSEIATMEELDSEIESVTTRLELMTDGNPRAMAEYERRAEEIARTEGKLDDLNTELEQIQDEITQIKALWEPQVDALVERISDGFSRNFEKIGCAGQVQINKHEDFDQWSIKILVRFRENEELAILDSHRQSGGERAVSTIFYLMALQDMARSPFRVVDEINQGMDPRNERMVHERMVDIACQERTSQYFLITPKLLNGLKFHPKMKVHCIASGEYMPSDYHDLDFPSLLDIALRVKGQA